VPAASIYAGKWAAIDEELVNEGRLLRLSSREDIASLTVKKKSGLKMREMISVCREVADLILE
jgi:predicted glycosyltransferase